MSEDIIRIKSISELHKGLGMEKPKHPLITILDFSKVCLPEELVGKKMTSDLYCISLKDADCGLIYGRNHYDFDEGVLIFTAPDQVMTGTKDFEKEDRSGWMMYFHPDLIRRSALGDKIDSYTFFSYEAHEALHLSENEERLLNQTVENIKLEYEQRIDDHSEQVIVASLELLLSYCSRFYARQMNTRSNHNKDIVSDVEKLLKEYINSDRIVDQGAPTIQFLAEQVHLSASYLSDLLKKETGRSGKDHINDFLVSKAKNKLLSSKDSVSEIAYSLGFNYPHYFSRLFKAKTGMSPLEYRQLN
ncbi:helix-turn-helix domain-containing protein [Sediminitomix flava]|uniref:AraC family transcriptional regulator n=1 Tax=Sediminitomix flava TaxID=379075 RepID=A0A315ZAN3_SEDFL|nr:helix-turn-helix transcriptional regulator [Sediminitomix flava]PWJ42410.1 AraC family transcriptional regulator [Sediminitomix flava]